ncbi:MAG: c-type cytochrome [Aquisalimonadaceae bacterium]
MAAVTGAALAVGPAQAEDADPVAGGELAATCLGCHGIQGARNAYPSYRVPKIGGQNEAYLYGALKAYQTGDRDHPTMRAQTMELGDQEMRDIAAYFARQK